ncbi:MAG: pitrilysin family protein [Bacteroidales bacterium]|jgi:predicted Zn-dependent peptidase
MIDFSRFSLENGLRILVHEDRSTPLVAMSLLYDAGSRDEDPDLTGLAHLFEHLMFGGTSEIPDFDTQLQLAGGESNAFTTPDLTNFYITVPASNIETAFWLESDRMNCPDFSSKNLEIQKKVVIEEFNQRYMNMPYGDAMLILRPMAYKVHPYRWTAIGSDPSHVKNASLSDIRNFFFSHYAPNKAILSLAGNITPGKALTLTEKWFGNIERRKIKKRILTSEPRQNKERAIVLERDVPASALYKAWHTGPRTGNDFYTCDMITDILAGGESGRLYNRLVRQRKFFSEIDAYITSDIDPGLIIIHGKLMKDRDFMKAEESIYEIIDDLKKGLVSTGEMAKVKNKFESSIAVANTSVLNKALNLSYFELLGNPDLINNETDLYKRIDKSMVADIACKYLTRSNCSTIYYKSINCKQ